MNIQLLEKLPYLGEMIRKAYRFEESLEFLRSSIDVPDEVFTTFQRQRHTQTYTDIFDKKEPLISICVATYNRAEKLTERCLRSILNQDYTNIEVIVVGDGCTDDTETRVRNLGDSRVAFHNLPQRGDYPVEPEWRWMVAGTTPLNHALDLANGDFITHLDDDDEYLPGRLSLLVHFIQSTRSDIVWHPFWYETPTGRWKRNHARGFRLRNVTTSSVLYHKWFSRIHWDINAYRTREPGDWNRFRKFHYLGARSARFPRPLLRHYRERGNT